MLGELSTLPSTHSDGVALRRARASSSPELLYDTVLAGRS
jgi:hypothetical protein